MKKNVKNKKIKTIWKNSSISGLVLNGINVTSLSFLRTDTQIYPVFDLGAFIPVTYMEKYSKKQVN